MLVNSIHNPPSCGHTTLLERETVRQKDLGRNITLLPASCIPLLHN